MEVCIPSYNRPNKVITTLFFPEARIVIPSSQKEAYKKNYQNFWIIPDERDGSASKKRNAILDYSTEEQIVMIDDDFMGVSGKDVSSEWLLAVFSNLFRMRGLKDTSMGI